MVIPDCAASGQGHEGTQSSMGLQHLCEAMPVL